MSNINNSGSTPEEVANKVLGMKPEEIVEFLKFLHVGMEVKASGKSSHESGCFMVAAGGISFAQDQMKRLSEK